jgi:short-subunit dehydrogenase
MDDSQAKTVVITGASSGIGKAIALTLAKEGMNLVLAARREAILQEVASECEALGGTAIAVKTDVTNKSEVENLRETAISFFGIIDVWINNAGTMAIGELNETPLEAHEQVIRTNLIAPLYGIYSILPYFKERKKGIIINTVSIGAYVPTPFAASYSAGKFGLRGLDEAIRSEVM